MAASVGGMIPLHVQALMRREVEWDRPVALDALLAASVARRLDMPRPSRLSDVVDIPIPIAREPGGRFHLASQAHVELPVLFSREQYVHKRAPWEHYATLCDDKVKRVMLDKEPDKSWRVPKIGARYASVHWWCVGEPEGVRELLLGVTRIGARRRHGCGDVREWIVEECEPWEGFPVLRDGQPLRNLPLDHPGLTPGAPMRMGRLTMPYFLREGEEMLACPGQ